ncbi:hypothetical protein ACHAW6_003357 [Cyclotella cf. meneghiniana]
MLAAPNEFLRFILAQQQWQRQQQQQPQRQGASVQESMNQQLQQLYHRLGPAAPALNAAQPTSKLDALSRVVANYLQGTPRGGTNAASPASNHGLHSLPLALAAQVVSHNQSISPQINNGTPSVSDCTSIHQQLLTVAKVLTAVNPGFGRAALEQVLATGAHLQQQPRAQQQQLQSSNTQVLPQANVADATSSNTLCVNSHGNNNAPNIAMKTGNSPKASNNFQNSNTKKVDCGEPIASTPTRFLGQSHSNNKIASPSTSSLNDIIGVNRKPSPTDSSGSVSLPAMPVSLLTLQTWSIEQLGWYEVLVLIQSPQLSSEYHIRKLQENNQPIPNTVRIVLEDVRNKEEKKHAKRMANRKSASTSRSRKKQLIDELTAAHAKLRRQALILAYLPDPVVNIRHLIQVLVDAEQRANTAQQEGWQQNRDDGASSQENGERNSVGSRDNSYEANAVSRSSDQSFRLPEVNFDGVDEEDAPEKSTYSSISPTRKKNHKTANNKAQATMAPITYSSSSLSEEMCASEDKEGRPVKKTKANPESEKGNSERAASFKDFKLSGTLIANVYNVIGSSVTANNADAELYSLAHHSKNETNNGDVTTKLFSTGTQQQPCVNQKPDAYSHTASKSSEKQEDSRSMKAVSFISAPSDMLNSWEALGYMPSNQSSGSSFSGNSFILKNGNRHRPLAPTCNVSFIRGDFTTIWCELTSSIHTRTRNDEDSEVGIIDLNPKATTETETEDPNVEEKELFLCLRPIVEGGKVDEKLHLPQQTRADNNPSDRAVGTSCSETETDCTRCGHTKKWTFPI